MTLATPSQRSKKLGKRRQCWACKERLYNGDAAVRVSDNDGMNSSNGSLRYWLCRRCARVWEVALLKVIEGAKA